MKLKYILSKRLFISYYDMRALETGFEFQSEKLIINRLLILFSHLFLSFG
jgi:hypothetical protein